MVLAEILEALDEIEAGIDRELERKVYDTHDFSSSNYSAYDDGWNTGVQAATELFRQRIERALAEQIVRART